MPTSPNGQHKRDLPPLPPDPWVFLSINFKPLRRILLNLQAFQNALAGISETETDWPSVSQTQLSIPVCGHISRTCDQNTPHTGTYVKWTDQCVCKPEPSRLCRCEIPLGRTLNPVFTSYQHTAEVSRIVPSMRGNNLGLRQTE